MPLKIDIDKPFLQRAVEAAIASLKRSAKTAHNPMMVKIIEEDIARYTHGLNTIQEIK